MTGLDLDAIKKQHALDLELGRWSDSTEPLLAEVERLTAENAELRMRVTVLEDESRSHPLAAAQARIDAVLALHYCRKDGTDGFDPFCDYDLNDWPCATARALTGDTP